MKTRIKHHPKQLSFKLLKGNTICKKRILTTIMLVEQDSTNREIERKKEIDILMTLSYLIYTQCNTNQ